MVSFHREENVDYEDNLISFLDDLNEISKCFELPVIVSTHPRTKMRIEKLKNIKLDEKIIFLKPLGF